MILDHSNCRPSKIWAEKGSKFTTNEDNYGYKIIT